MDAADSVYPRLCAHLLGDLACCCVGHLLVVRDGNRLRVIQAQPKVLISGQVLDALVHGCTGHEDVEVLIPDSRSWVGAVITIRAVNLTVVYRIGDPVAWDHEHPSARSLLAADLWPAEWPD